MILAVLGVLLTLVAFIVCSTTIAEFLTANFFSNHVGELEPVELYRALIVEMSSVLMVFAVLSAAIAGNRDWKTPFWISNPASVVCGFYLFVILRLQTPRGFMPAYREEEIRVAIYTAAAATVGSFIGVFVRSLRRSR